MPLCFHLLKYKLDTLASGSQYLILFHQVLVLCALQKGMVVNVSLSYKFSQLETCID